VAPKLADALQHVPVLTDVNSDQQQNGQDIELVIDRDTASRLKLNPAAIDNTLYDAFGPARRVDHLQRTQPVSRGHGGRAAVTWQSPDALRSLWVSTAGGTVSGTQGTNAVAGTVISTKTAASSSAATVAADTARNQATNSLANTGRGAGLDRRRRQRRRRADGAARGLHPLRTG